MQTKFCPGSMGLRSPTPEYIECPECGEEMEVWSDEPLARCPSCGLWVAKERGASCIDWCAHARECIGLEKYERLQRSRPPEPNSQDR